MRFIFFLSFVCLISKSQSQTFTELKDIQFCKEQIKKAAHKMNTLQVDVDELKEIPLLKEPEKGKGKLYFMQKNFMNSSVKNIFLFDGKSLKIMENGKVIKNPTQQQVGKKIHEMMLNLLSGKFLDEKMFRIDYFVSKTQYKLVLYPKNAQMKKNLSHIECYFNAKDFLCEKLIFIESQNNKVSYSFLNPKVNVTLSSKIFQQF